MNSGVFPWENKRDSQIELLRRNAPGKSSWTGLSLVWFAKVTPDAHLRVSETADCKRTLTVTRTFRTSVWGLQPRFGVSRRGSDFPCPCPAFPWFFGFPWLILRKEFPCLFGFFLFFQGFSGFGREEKSLVNLGVSLITQNNQGNEGQGLLRFLLICSNLFSEQIRTNQGTHFCQPLLQVPETWHSFYSCSLRLED